MVAIHRIPEGTLVGEVEVVTITSVHADARALTWQHNIQVVWLRGWGDIASVIPEATASCPVECTVSAADFPFRLLSDNPSGTSTMTSAVVPGTTGQVVAEQSRWTIVFGQMGSIPSPPVTFTSEAVRCDTSTPNATAGCALSRHTPTLHYTTAANGELATHIRDAQAAGLPGSPTSGRPLTRQTNAALINRNRSIACPSSLPRPPGHQCDEYPFASTNQGAYLSGGLYSARMIDENDNEQGGRELNAFYRDNRIVNSDPFHVQID
ncbi:NucA/NucB deoxyribonuclease domain-containing protein [Saccharothrix sp. NRRL B-16348]|uniref:NucA/NucB deoxyribonuclease domain-containing protein n=1 Tax=Saccharothrix sp. NRRL B-16348 TaxID=1415542 RepID=UPI0018D1EE99|nr:NucA/NucB deoxyribonuclease domain-containing protein [Saccharothrix sp. NRRL B-16348]